MIKCHNVLQAAIEVAKDSARKHNGYLIPNVWMTWLLVMLNSNIFHPTVIDKLKTLCGRGVIMH